IAEQYELTVRHVGDPADPTFVGHVPFYNDDRLLPQVAVTDDGSTVFYGIEHRAPVLRWLRSTGTSDEIASPLPAGWPGDYDAFSVTLTGVSADGSRAFWQAGRYGSAGLDQKRLIADTTSGEIVRER